MATRIEEEEEISRIEAGLGKPGKHTDLKFQRSETFLENPAVITLCQKGILGISHPKSRGGNSLGLRRIRHCSNVLAELIGTFFVIFSGCGSVVVNKTYDGTVSFPGICITWGLIVTVMVYTLGHVSGAHFNPAVTVTFALLGRFPWKEVPVYIIAQLAGSLLASCTLEIMMTVKSATFFGTIPSGSDGQSLAAEIVISFLLMFVISGVATDSRAIGELAGLAVGMTITLNVFVAGPISGASMNPARSLGPAIVRNTYKGIWVYIVGPFIGIVAGGFAYNLIRFTDKPIRELTQSKSFMKKSASKDGSG